MAEKMLVVEDNAAIRRLVGYILRKNDYEVMEAFDGQSALEMIEIHSPDLILLDMKIPRLSGIEVCRWVRQHASKIPIIFLSEMTDKGKKVEALDAGADDYITKPFDQDELVARIRAVLRRSTDMRKTDELPKIRRPIIIGDLVIEQNLKRVLVSGVDAGFTPIEFDLLLVLAFNLDTVVHHETLLERIWGLEYRDHNHFLHIYFGRIRKKLGDVYGPMIQTFPKMGYVLNSKTPSA